ncbi:MAG: DUF4838 domain-containing protein [Candidatus Hydrogenedentes bacterium]|nr:DUF4838 domain-containing protein [Candidatus Hydrogenedentota bacterium]
MRKVLALVFLSSISAAWAETAGITIAQDGQSKATIVISAQAGDKVKLAAAELQTYVEKISDAHLPLATDADFPQGALILVGASKLTDAVGVKIPSGLSDNRRDEGFVIVCAADRLLLAGNNDGPYHGTEYAVYDFLRSLGVRWYMPGEYGEIIPHTKTIFVPAANIVETPDFAMRDWWCHTPPGLAEIEKQWKLRNKMNPDALFFFPRDSTVRNVTAPQTMLKEKPELFALNQDGTRNPYLPNLSNPEAVQFAAEVIKKYFREHPTENSYGFSPDDGLPRDFNPETMKRNQGFTELGQRQGVPTEVSTSEEWFRFVNEVIAEVHKEFPKIYIVTNGYANRDFPPQGVKIDDHIVIMFAAIWSCTLHAYDDPHCWQKRLQGRMLERWLQKTPNVWVYGYNYNMLVSALTPLPEFTKLRHDFPSWKKWGILGFLDETRNVWAEPGIASKYLRAQLEWRADANVDAILDEFFAQWYGAAAAPMKAYWLAIDRAITETPMHGHEDRIMPLVYTSPLVADCERFVAEAEKIADTDRTRLHVKADRISLEHLKAYRAMSAAEAAADYAEAAKQADTMMALRKDLHTIDPSYIQPFEEGYDAGVWYWRITERAKYFRELADKLSGVTGDRVALFPESALFRTDAYDEGLVSGWYEPGQDLHGWHSLVTTKPFFTQGYDDAEGHTYTGAIWYRLAADVPESVKGRKVTLYAPVALAEAWCWVNGQYVGHRPYLEAYIRPAPLEFDVTDALQPGKENSVVIRISTGLAPAAAPEGLFSRVFLYAPK